MASGEKNGETLLEQAHRLEAKGQHDLALEAYAAAEQAFTREARPERALHAAVATAKTQHRQGRTADARATYLRVAECAQGDTLATLRLQALTGAATAAYAAPDPVEAATLARDAWKLAMAQGEARTAAHMAHLLGALALNRGELEEAQGWLEGALAVRRKAQDHLAVADTLRGLGDIHLARGEHETARDAYAAALAGWSTPHTADRAGATLCRLAALERGLGQLDEAESASRDALVCARTSGDEPLQAAAWTELGHVLAKRGLVAEAAAAFDTAYGLHTKQGNKPGIAASRCHRAQLAVDAGALDDALVSFSEALNVFEGLGQARVAAQLRGAMAQLHARLGDLDAAGEALNRALADARRVAHQPTVGRLMVNQGGLLLARGQVDDAAATINQGLEKLSDVPVDAALAHIARAQALLCADRLADALTSLRRAHRLATDADAQEVLQDVTTWTSRAEWETERTTKAATALQHQIDALLSAQRGLMAWPHMAALIVAEPTAPFVGPWLAAATHLMGASGSRVAALEHEALTLHVGKANAHEATTLTALRHEALALGYTLLGLRIQTWEAQFLQRIGRTEASERLLEQALDDADRQGARREARHIRDAIAALTSQR